MASKIIAVDFDGTLCENKWPKIGDPNLELIEYLLDQRRNNGAKIILWTCRTGELLQEAGLWCLTYGLWFNAVNENVPEIVKKFGEDTRKIFADEYIDDRACSKFKLPFMKGEN